MTSFESMHQDSVAGKLVGFDRMIFKGHLIGLFPKGSFASFMWKNGYPLTKFSEFVQNASSELKRQAEALARDAGRPFLYLAEAATKRSGDSKEDRAKRIAEQDGISDGLICVFSVLEPCQSLIVRGNRDTHKLEVVSAGRKCLHFYFYFIDPEFGLMHVRLQSWFPFQIQVYVNGREWLCRRLDEEGIGYRRHENALLEVEDLRRAQELFRRLFRRKWCRVLNAFAARVNPWLHRVTRSGFGGYFWVLDQCEIATDVMFRTRADLEALLPNLHRDAVLLFSPEDVLRFLGRRPHWALKGEVSTSLLRRPEGFRVKHRLKRNSIKFYDKWSVLRIETTINNPREFRVLRSVVRGGKSGHRWVPMGKSVVNVARYAEVGEQANQRYLDAIAHIRPSGKVIDHFDRLCHPKTRDGRRIPRMEPVSKPTAELFAAILSGEHRINGFRNRDIARRLASKLPNAVEVKRFRERISRTIRRLRDHGLVAKVPHSHLYRVTATGDEVMSYVLRFRLQELPQAA